MIEKFDTIPEMASSLLRRDMKRQIKEMNSLKNYIETFLSGKRPTRNNRALHFIEKHEKRFRKENPLILPISAFHGMQHA